MIIAFCGHSEIFGNEWLDDKISEILENEIKGEYVDFYLGGYGKFDFIAQKCCIQYQKAHTNSKLYFITPYPDDVYLKNRKLMLAKFDEIIYPHLEKTPKRYAIIERNKWIVKKADLLITYVNHPWGGAAKVLEYACKCQKRLINLGTYNIEDL